MFDVRSLDVTKPKGFDIIGQCSETTGLMNDLLSPSKGSNLAISKIHVDRIFCDDRAKFKEIAQFKIAGKNVKIDCDALSMEQVEYLKLAKEVHDKLNAKKSSDFKLIPSIITMITRCESGILDECDLLKMSLKLDNVVSIDKTYDKEHGSKENLYFRYQVCFEEDVKTYATYHQLIRALIED